MKSCAICKCTNSDDATRCDSCGSDRLISSKQESSYSLPKASPPSYSISQPSSSPTTDGIRVGSIVRDVVIVWILTAIGGFVVGFATGGRQQDPQGYILGILAANFLLGTVAFTIVGCLAPADRWRHLGFVAIGAWLTSIINVLFFGVTVPQWIFGALFMAFIMGFGGAISYVFKKRPVA